MPAGSDAPTAHVHPRLQSQGGERTFQYWPLSSAVAELWKRESITKRDDEPPWSDKDGKRAPVVLAGFTEISAVLKLSVSTVVQPWYSVPQRTFSKVAVTIEGEPAPTYIGYGCAADDCNARPYEQGRGDGGGGSRRGGGSGSIVGGGGIGSGKGRERERERRTARRERRPRRRRRPHRRRPLL